MTYSEVSQVLARSHDKAGNVEQAPATVAFVIDRVAPQLTVTVEPARLEKVQNGHMVNVNYIATFMDVGSENYAVVGATLVDEYGKLSQTLNKNLSGKVAVEAWCDGKDKDGRLYTFRFTVQDMAGNQASTDATLIVLHNK